VTDDGRSVHGYRAPLFIAWQLTNRCQAHCVTCCEESGPDQAWRDELRPEEAIELAQRIVAFGVPYVAFGGGEPLGVTHCWRLLELFSAAGVAIKTVSRVLNALGRPNNGVSSGVSGRFRACAA